MKEKLKISDKDAAFIADLKAVLKRMPRNVCLDWDTFDGKLQVIKKVKPGEGKFIVEIKVKTFA